MYARTQTMKNTDLGITPQDAMPTVQEVARFFGVPPHMINNEISPNSNVITLDELTSMSKWDHAPLFAKQVRLAIRRTRIRKRKGKIKKRI